MNKKTMLLILTAVGTAMFALSAVAWAGEWKVDCPGGKATCEFTTSGGHAELRAVEEPTITCTSSTGRGTATNEGTTATAEGTFTGCKAVGFVPCNTSGAASGVIKIASGVAHNVYLEDNKTKLGILATPPTTTIICSGLSSFEATGSAIGEVTQGCNTESETFNGTASSAVGNEKTQKWEQITKTGATFDGSATTEPSGTAKTVVGVGTGTLTFTGKAKITCP